MNGARGIGKGIVEQRYWLGAAWNGLLGRCCVVLYATQCRDRAVSTGTDMSH